MQGHRNFISIVSFYKIFVLFCFFYFVINLLFIADCLIVCLFDKDEWNILVNGPGLAEVGVVTTGGYATVDSFIAGRVFSDDQPRTHRRLLADGNPWVLPIQRPTVHSVPLQFFPHDILV